MTIEDRLASLELQLGRVKRRNRWLLGGILLVAGGLLLPAIFEATAFRARAQQTEISAYQIKIVDENGKVRCFLGMGLAGPTLYMNDVFGKASVIITAETDGPHMDLYDNGRRIWAAIR